MEIIKTPIPDLLIVRPKVFEDARGYFYETYNEKNFSEAGLNIHFCQDNQSKSVYGVIRGLHYQLQPDSQCKLVSAIQGGLGCSLDLNFFSCSSKWYGIELSAENVCNSYSKVLQTPYLPSNYLPTNDAFTTLRSEEIL